MDRKDFMKSLGGLCTGAGFLGCGCVRSLALDKGRDATEETPLAEKFAFAQGYVKRLFDILDQELDPRARTHLVEAMGSACFQAWTKDEAPHLPEAVILRRVLKPRLLVTFFAVIALAIVLTGYLFNWIL